MRLYAECLSKRLKGKEVEKAEITLVTHTENGL